MKILFWILAIASIAFGFFMTIVSYFSHGLDLACTEIGVVVCIAGMFSVVVSIICAVLGIIKGLFLVFSVCIVLNLCADVMKNTDVFVKAIENSNICGIISGVDFSAFLR